MDLIDRQAVVDLFKTYQPRMATSVIKFGNALKELPTVEAEPVRHGHWIDNDIDSEAWNFCSVCGEQAIDNYDYCPNCGAKMDGKVEYETD